MWSGRAAALGVVTVAGCPPPPPPLRPPAPAPPPPAAAGPEEAPTPGFRGTLKTKSNGAAGALVGVCVGVDVADDGNRRHSTAELVADVGARDGDDDGEFFGGTGGRNSERKSWEDERGVAKRECSPGYRPPLPDSSAGVVGGRAEMLTRALLPPPPPYRSSCLSRPRGGFTVVSMALGMGRRETCFPFCCCLLRLRARKHITTSAPRRIATEKVPVMAAMVEEAAGAPGVPGGGGGITVVDADVNAAGDEMMEATPDAAVVPASSGTITEVSGDSNGSVSSSPAITGSPGALRRAVATAPEGNRASSSMLFWLLSLPVPSTSSFIPWIP